MNKMFNQKKLRFIVVMMTVMMLIVVGVQGCGKQKTEKTMKLGLLPIEENLPFYVAEQEKMFDKAGIKVELTNFSSAQEMMAAIQSGQIDGEITDQIVSNLLKKGGTDIRIVAISLGKTAQEGRFAILSAPKSSIRSVDDLKNVPIGGTENTIIQYVTDTLLKQNGLSEDEIKITSIPKFPVRLDMLLNDQIQAAVFTDPLASFAELQGAHLVIDDTKENISQTVILFRNATIQSNPDEVKAVLKVYQEAGQAITKNPDQYRSLILTKAQVPDPLKNTYKVPTYSKLQLPSAEQINMVQQWMVKKGLLSVPIPYAELVNTTLLP